MRHHREQARFKRAASACHSATSAASTVRGQAAPAPCLQTAPWRRFGPLAQLWAHRDHRLKQIPTRRRQIVSAGLAQHHPARPPLWTYPRPVPPRQLQWRSNKPTREVQSHRAAGYFQLDLAMRKFSFAPRRIKIKHSGILQSYSQPAARTKSPTVPRRGGPV